MLRITTLSEDQTQVTLKLEGQLVTEWANELERLCGRLLDEPKRVVLDLKEVKMIDRRAVAVLRNLTGRHVRMVNCRGLIEEVLSQADAP